MSIRWPIVSVIFRREVRDQLRDRRTLFMIFILPMFLYPIIMFGALQLSAAFEQKPRTVVVVGAENLPAEPPLLNPEGGGFNPALFDPPSDAQRLIVRRVEARGEWLDAAYRERATRSGAADVVLSIPSTLRDQIERKETLDIPVDYDSADERSQNTYYRLREVLARWQKSLVSRRLVQDKLPASYTEPIKVKPIDVATPVETGNSVWARLFPFLLVMMSLTGAFYPAVDICAGEKERGTMETLLISPASRAEIVVGKFLTVFVASVMTALLNLVCMAITGVGLARQVMSSGSPATSAAASAGAAASRRAISAIAVPSVETGIWILLLLIPLAAFFSALCLALAVLAKSMKEGQYYMTPLYLVCLPLMFLSLAPGIELNLFYSLLPVTGVALLLKSLILGDYVTAGQYFLPVLVPTCVYGALALRWAIDQFQREDVLFREAERFDLKVWLIHLVRDRGPLPTGGQALFCFALMLTSAWFLTQYLANLGLATSTRAMAAGQIGFILIPPVVLALLLTSSPGQTLRLRWPAPRYVALAVGLAVALNPLVNELGRLVESLFPMSKELQEALGQILGSKQDLLTSLVLFALLPAICEELAFRGFILSGLQHAYKTRTAILLSALLFGIMHVLLSLFQQLFNATLLGIVIGLLAVRSGSIVPGMIFHLLNNGTAVVMGRWLATPGGKQTAAWLYRDVEHGLYHKGLVAAGLIASVILLSLLRWDRPDAKHRPADWSQSHEPEPASVG
ncbi:MAG: ABC transporter permease subunit/CPBP intramembrane protease [Isosphaeraceae bacterium]